MAKSPEVEFPCECIHCGYQLTQAEHRNNRNECNACMGYFAQAMYRWKLGAYDPEIDLLMLEDPKNIN